MQKKQPLFKKEVVLKSSATLTNLYNLDSLMVLLCSYKGISLNHKN